MTNEQVITRIKHNSMYKDDRETADYIINALEQQPSEDCVSREQAIVQLSIDLSEIKLPRIKDSLDKLPPVTPTQGWILVSERLPEQQEDGDSNFTDWVLVSIRINPYQSIVCSAYYCFSETKWYMERMGCGEITAWQPLPKPYEDKRGNEE